MSISQLSNFACTKWKNRKSENIEKIWEIMMSDGIVVWHLTDRTYPVIVTTSPETDPSFGSYFIASLGEVYYKPWEAMFEAEYTPCTWHLQRCRWESSEKFPVSCENNCNRKGVCFPTNKNPHPYTGSCACFPNWSGDRCDSQCKWSKNNRKNFQVENSQGFLWISAWNTDNLLGTDVNAILAGSAKLATRVSVFIFH